MHKYIATTFELESGSKKTSVRAFGIDTIRFIAALFVFFFHGGAPTLPSLLRSPLIDNITYSAFNGIGAVVVFFIISGFCIHYPFINAEKLQVIPFYVRRLIRIGAPMVACMGVLYIADAECSLATTEKFWRRPYFFGITSISWSLICEIAYYFMYPVIYLLMRWVGVRIVLVASLLLSVTLVIINGWKVYFWQYDIVTMSLVGLPYWLTGCFLAETWRGKYSSKGVMLVLTVLVYLYLVVVLYIWKFGGYGLAQPIVYMPFAFLVYWWLQYALRSKTVSKLFILEWFGTWSYSLYLTHKPLITAYLQYIAPLTGDYFVLKAASVLGGAWLFAWAVEWPSHKLASSAARHAFSNASPRVSGLR
jgi:peptidoglycan/LPS O-acetylase OafA/YrhL